MAQVGLASFGLDLPAEDAVGALVEQLEEAVAAAVTELRSAVAATGAEAEADLPTLDSNRDRLVASLAARASCASAATRVWERGVHERRAVDRMAAQSTLAALQTTVQRTLDTAAAADACAAAPQALPAHAAEEADVALPLPPVDDAEAADTNDANATERDEGDTEAIADREEVKEGAGACDGDDDADGSAPPTPQTSSPPTPSAEQRGGGKAAAAAAAAAAAEVVDLAAYDQELVQLEAAAAAVEEAARVLRRRTVRIERQRSAANAVKRWSGETAELIAAQTAAVRRAGGVVRHLPEPPHVSVGVSVCPPSDQISAGVSCGWRGGWPAGSRRAGHAHVARRTQRRSCGGVGGGGGGGGGGRAATHAAGAASAVLRPRHRERGDELHCCYRRRTRGMALPLDSPL